MTKRDLLSIVLKVFGVILVTNTILAIPRDIYYLLEIRSGNFGTNFNVLANVLWTIGGLLLAGAAGLILIGCSEGIARMLVKEDRDMPIPNLAASQRPWFSIAARVVGLVALAQGLPVLIGAIIRATSVTTADTAGMQLFDKFRVLVANITATGMNQFFYTGLAQIIVGLCLLFGAEQLARLVIRKKQAPKPEASQDG